MTECVKIKCDDCKFQENCVDYGWDGCKKFTPTPSEPLTNEEWFCTLPTEEKAEWLSNRDEFIYDCGQKGTTPKIMDKDEWEKWLKEKHNE